MKKKYIFITFSIINAGGSQLYVRNKVNFLRKQGYDVFVFSAMEGPVLIDGLREFEQCIDVNLAGVPQLMTKRGQRKTLEKMVLTIGKCTEDCVVESHSTKFGLWGEMLAQRLGIKHLLFSLEENNAALNKEHLQFLTFKLRQHALCGIIERSLPLLFSKHGIQLKDNQYYTLRAHCNNPVEDITSVFELPQADYTICLMGRLNKGFMLPSAEAIAEYVAQNPTARFNVVIIGGGDKQTENKFQNCFSSLANCHCLLTGFLMPIPYSFLTKMDVVVTSAGCCTACTNYGLAVISVDGNDYQPIGMYKQTTDNSLFRTDEPIRSLSLWLDDVFKEKKYINHIIPFVPIEFDFSDHLIFSDQIDASMGYFDVNRIQLEWKYIISRRLRRMIYNIIGVNLYTKISKLHK